MKMKKKLLIVLVILVVCGFAGYKYIYKDHRDVSSEDASFKITLADLKADFEKNDSIANTKYLDKAIAIYGKVTSLDLVTNEIIIDSSLSATIKGKVSVKNGNQVTIKGRFIGYDDLLEEYKMDECVIE
jgi:predicted negative regulator of RcsB-dependent stress response